MEKSNKIGIGQTKKEYVKEHNVSINKIDTMSRNTAKNKFGNVTKADADVDLKRMMKVGNSKFVGKYSIKNITKGASKFESNNLANKFQGHINDKNTEQNNQLLDSRRISNLFSYKGNKQDETKQKSNLIKTSKFSSAPKNVNQNKDDVSRITKMRGNKFYLRRNIKKYTLSKSESSFLIKSHQSSIYFSSKNLTSKFRNNQNIVPKLSAMDKSRNLHFKKYYSNNKIGIAVLVNNTSDAENFDIHKNVNYAIANSDRAIHKTNNPPKKYFRFSNQSTQRYAVNNIIMLKEQSQDSAYQKRFLVEKQRFIYKKNNSEQEEIDKKVKDHTKQQKTNFFISNIFKSPSKSNEMFSNFGKIKAIFNFISDKISGNEASGLIIGVAAFAPILLVLVTIVIIVAIIASAIMFPFNHIWNSATGTFDKTDEYNGIMHYIGLEDDLVAETNNYITYLFSEEHTKEMEEKNSDSESEDNPIYDGPHWAAETMVQSVPTDQYYKEMLATYVVFNSRKFTTKENNIDSDTESAEETAKKKITFEDTLLTDADVKAFYNSLPFWVLKVEIKFYACDGCKTKEISVPIMDDEGNQVDSRTVEIKYCPSHYYEELNLTINFNLEEVWEHLEFTDADKKNYQSVFKEIDKTIKKGVKKNNA